MWGCSSKDFASGAIAGSTLSDDLKAALYRELQMDSRG
jgi:hypothetical protein